MRFIQVNRLITSPLVGAFIWLYITENFQDSFMVAWSNEILNTSLNFPISYESKIFIFGLGFGYLYSTCSLFLKVRTFKGLVFVILFATKVLLVTLFTGIFGVYLYLLEFALMPFIYIYKQSRIKMKEKKRKRIEKKDRKIELEEFKEELISELKKELIK